MTFWKREDYGYIDKFGGMGGFLGLEGGRAEWEDCRGVLEY